MDRHVCLCRSVQAHRCVCIYLSVNETERERESQLVPSYDDYGYSYEWMYRLYILFFQQFYDWALGTADIFFYIEINNQRCIKRRLGEKEKKNITNKCEFLINLWCADPRKKSKTFEI